MALTTQRILLGHVKGEKGDAGSIEVGTTTTGNPGDPAEVTLATGSTPEHAILDFLLPRGDEGPAGSSTTVHPMPGSNDIHDWVTPGAEGFYFGEGTGLTNAPDTGHWKYLAIATDDPAGQITLLGFSDDDRQMQKTCVAGTWGDWVEGGTAPKLIPAVAGTNLDTYRTPGLYYQPVIVAAESELIANQPINNPAAIALLQTRLNGAFSLLVERHVGLEQTYTAAITNRTFKRSTNTPTGVWGAWVEMTMRGAVVTPTNQQSGIVGGMSVNHTLLARMTPYLPNILGDNEASILGAMNLHGYDGNRTWFFTDIPNRVMRGGLRTVSQPQMTQAEYDTTTIPINFDDVGFLGSWGTSMWGYYDFNYEGPDTLRIFNEFHGFAFTRTTQALWIRYIGRLDQGPTLQVSVITLNGLPAGGSVTAMWATQFEIWLICNNMLHRAVLGRPHPQYSPDWPMWDRITGSPTFTAVSDPAIPAGITSNTRIHVEMVRVPTNPVGQRTPVRCVIWGATPANRVGFFDGDQWHALTLPFNITAPTSNAVVVFPTGRIGAYNRTNGHYWTCDNPMEATPTWINRYTVPNGQWANFMLTRGPTPGSPTFIARNNRWYPPMTEVWTDRMAGIGMWISNAGVPLAMSGGRTRPLDQDIWFAWPGELYYSNRQDIIPAGPLMPRQGYAYPCGNRFAHISIQADHATFSMLTQFQGFMVDIPPQAQVMPIPNTGVAATTLLPGGFAVSTTRDPVGRRINSFGVRNTAGF